MYLTGCLGMCVCMRARMSWTKKKPASVTYFPRSTPAIYPVPFFFFTHGGVRGWGEKRERDKKKFTKCAHLSRVRAGPWMPRPSLHHFHLGTGKHRLAAKIRKKEEEEEEGLFWGFHGSLLQLLLMYEIVDWNSQQNTLMAIRGIVSVSAHAQKRERKKDECQTEVNVGQIFETCGQGTPGAGVKSRWKRGELYSGSRP